MSSGKKSFKVLNKTYERLILFSVILIVICGSIGEWYSANYSESHQSGWQFLGMIVVATIVIPLPLIIGMVLDQYIKGLGKRFYFLTTLILVPGIYLTLWSGVLADEVAKPECYTRIDGICYETDSNQPYTGVYSDYYENGQLERRINYKNGKREGFGERFHENGQLLAIGHFKKGKQTGVDDRFYDSGEVYWRRNWKGGELHGVWESFYINGKTKILSNWKNGEELNQIRFTYYESGKLRQKGAFTGDKPNGLYEAFYESGQLERRGTFKEGERDGVWEYFDEDGKLIE